MAASRPVAVVSGGSSAIGLARVEAFLEVGWADALFGQQHAHVEQTPDYSASEQPHRAGDQLAGRSPGVASPASTTSLSPDTISRLSPSTAASLSTTPACGHLQSIDRPTSKTSAQKLVYGGALRPGSASASLTACQLFSHPTQKRRSSE